MLHVFDAVVRCARSLCPKPKYELKKRVKEDEDGNEGEENRVIVSETSKFIPHKAESKGILVCLFQTYNLVLSNIF